MEQTKHPVEFTGTGKEFFGIWIVNLLLTIVTLGIYAAWAKVRTRKYFAQHTSIADRRFDYHATGKQIFLGYVIVIGGYLAFNIIVTLVPILGLLGLGIFFVIPWLINRAMSFNARMTSWSGVRFGFDGKYWGAFRNFMLYPILALFTLYLAIPWVARANRRYVTNGHRLGTARFHFDSEMGPFLKAFGFALLWMIVAAGVLTVALNMPQRFAMLAYGGEAEVAIAILLVYVIILVAILPAALIYQAYIRNAVYANTSIEGGHGFESTISPTGLIWIALSNAAMVIVSLGLLSAFAQVRMMKYLADNTALLAAGSLDDFVQAEEEKQSALGEAFADFEGIDVGAAI